MPVLKPLALFAFVLVLAGCASARPEEVRFANGEVTLAGTLFLPSGPPPYPAVVLIQGDGPETRLNAEPLARLFARHGIAALVYDKRGTGGSSGRWEGARFDDLAGDALAGVEWLRGRDDIDPSRVGLWGGSQGGWIAPLAASRAPQVAFVIVKAGPATTPAAKATATSVARVERAGYPPAVVARVRRLMELQFTILRTGEGWAALDAEVARVRAEPWYPLVAVMRHSPWDSSWMRYGRDIDFDPAPLYARLEAPVLVLLGERDEDVPAPPTVAVLDSVRRTYGRDLTVHVFPGADHQIELPRRVSFRPNYAPGYLETTVAWARQHAGLPPE